MGKEKLGKLLEKGKKKNDELLKPATPVTTAGCNIPEIVQCVEGGMNLFF